MFPHSVPVYMLVCKILAAFRTLLSDSQLSCSLQEEQASAVVPVLQNKHPGNHPTAGNEPRPLTPPVRWC